MTANPNDVASAARVGKARALMFLGRYQEAADAVSDVPTEMLFNADFSENTTAEINEVYAITWGDFAVANLRFTVGNGEDPSRNNEEWAFYDEWFEQNLIIPPGFHTRTAFGAPSRPVSLQTVYGDPSVSPNGRSAPIPVATGWEARMIEAEAMLRNGEVAAAEDQVNALLADPTVNPLVKVEDRLTSPAATGETLGPFEPVDFTDDGGFVPEDDLPEMGRAYAAGLWLQSHRQHFLRRLFRNDGIDLFPATQPGDAMSLPVIRDELVNNPDIDTACPGGQNIPGKG